MGALRTVAVGTALTVTMACGSLLPSSGDDDVDDDGRTPPPGETRGTDASFDAPTTVPVDPTVDDPPLPASDASTTADATGDAGVDGGPLTTSDELWYCETASKGPFTSLTVCEAARSEYCDAPRADVIDAKACSDLGERHISCGACGTKLSFNARVCLCR